MGSVAACPEPLSTGSVAGRHRLYTEPVTGVDRGAMQACARQRGRLSTGGLSKQKTRRGANGGTWKRDVGQHLGLGNRYLDGRAHLKSLSRMQTLWFGRCT